MVSTRSGGSAAKNASAGEKRAAPPTKGSANKKAKKEQGQLEVDEEGKVGLQAEEAGEDASVHAAESANDNGKDIEDDESDSAKAQDKEEAKEGKEERSATPGAGEQEPQHGTLESGHIYFLYRPKIDAEDVQSIDDVSKFHILLIPKSGSHASGHYHRIIEVGKKKLPDTDAKREVIWGLIGGVGKDRSALKEAFGAYSYETKTKGEGPLTIPLTAGTRHQDAARPAARGHYILHSPRDEAADKPESTKQRDYKTMLVYEITTPTSDDFGRVQEELGIADKAAIALSVKDPDAPANNNPRAANMPREKKADYPPHLKKLFDSRRWIAPNPVSFLDYSGGEILLLSAHHELADYLGQDGDKIERDLDREAEQHATDVDGALRELGLGKKDTEIEALEGAWA